MKEAAIKIRRATPAQGEHIARLALLAGDGIPAYFWNQIKQENETVIDTGARKVMAGDNNFSYKNAHVAFYGENVAGLMLGYPLHNIPTNEEINQAPEFIRPLLMMDRKVPGTFYINMLATYPEYRSRGIGRALMEHAEEVAKSMDIDELSLQVFNENARALEFYYRLDYRKIAELPVVPHDCYPYKDKVYLLKKEIHGQPRMNNAG